LLKFFCKSCLTGAFHAGQAIYDWENDGSALAEQVKEPAEPAEKIVKSPDRALRRLLERGEESPIFARRRFGGAKIKMKCLPKKLFV
jgi:hypothetical protein